MTLFALEGFPWYGVAAVFLTFAIGWVAAVTAARQYGRGCKPKRGQVRLEATFPDVRRVVLWAVIPDPHDHPAGTWCKLGEYDRATGTRLGRFVHGDDTDDVEEPDAPTPASPFGI